MKVGPATLNAGFGKHQDFLPWHGLPKALRARAVCNPLYAEDSGKNGVVFLYLFFEALPPPGSLPE